MPINPSSLLSFFSPAPYNPKSQEKKGELPSYEEKTPDKRFAHEVVSSIVNNTNLEGSSTPNTSAWLQEAWEPTKEIAQHLGLTCGLEGLELHSSQSLLEEDDPGSRVFIVDSSKTTAEQMQQMVNRLKAGSFLVLRLSPTTEAEGDESSTHAINLVIQKQEKNDQLSISLINTGFGLSFHKPRREGDKNVYQSAQSFINISSEKINTQTFWSALCERPTVQGLYTLTHNYLGIYGERLVIPQAQAAYFSEFFTSPQQAGNCSMQSLFATIEFIILQRAKTPMEGRADYKRCMLFYKMRSCILMAHQYKKSLCFDRCTHALISKSIPLLNKRLEKAQSALYLQKDLQESEECYHQLKEVLVGIKQQLEEQKLLDTREYLSWSKNFTQFTPLPENERFAQIEKLSEATPSPKNKEAVDDSWKSLAGENFSEKFSSFYSKNFAKNFPYKNIYNPESQKSLDFIAFEIPFPLEDSLTEKERLLLFEDLKKAHLALVDKVEGFNRKYRTNRVYARRFLLAITKLEYLMHEASEGVPELREVRKLGGYRQEEISSLMGLFPDVLSSKEKHCIAILDAYRRELNQRFEKQEKKNADELSGMSNIFEVCSAFLSKKEGFNKESPIDAEVLKNLGLEDLDAPLTVDELSKIFSGELRPPPAFKHGQEFIQTVLKKRLFAEAIKKANENGERQEIDLNEEFEWTGWSLPGTIFLGRKSKNEKASPPAIPSPEDLEERLPIPRELNYFQNKDQKEINKTPLELLQDIQKNGISSEKLRQLPLPQSEDWKEIKSESDKKNALSAVNQIFSKIENSIKELSKKPDQKELLTFLFIAQSQLMLIYYVIEQYTDPEQTLSQYRMDLPELRALPLTHFSKFLSQDKETFHALCDYMRDRELNEGSADYLLDFTVGKRSDKNLSRYKTIINLRKRLSDTFIILCGEDKTKKNALSSTLKKLHSQEKEKSSEKALIHRELFHSPEMEQLLESLEEESRDNYCSELNNLAREYPNDSKEYHDIYYSIYDRVWAEARPSLIQRELSQAEAAGTEGSLLVLQRLLFTPVEELKKIPPEKFTQSIDKLLSNPYLEEQLEAAPEFFEVLIKRIHSLKAECIEKNAHTLFFLFLQTEARLYRNSKDGLLPHTQKLVEEALSYYRDYNCPSELAQAPLCAMHILSEVPLEFWTEEDQIAYAALFKAYTFLTNQQESNFPSTLPQHISWLHLTLCQGPFRPKKLGPALEEALGLLLSKEERLTWELNENNQIEGMSSTTTLIWDLDTTILTLNGQSSLRNQAQLNKEINSFKQLGFRIQSRSDSKLLFLDKEERVYELNPNWRDNSFSISTHFGETPYERFSNGPLFNKIEQYVTKKLNIPASEIVVLQPTSKNSNHPIHILHEGKRILSIPQEADGVLDFGRCSKDLDPDSETARYLILRSQIPENTHDSDLGAPELSLSNFLTILGPRALIWSDKNGKLKEIEAPELKLNFDIKEVEVKGEESPEFRLSVREVPGFYLSPDQDTGLKEFVPGSLLLRNEKGEKKLLLLKQPLETLFPDLEHREEEKKKEGSKGIEPNFKDPIPNRIDPFKFSEALANSEGRVFSNSAYSVLTLQETHGELHIVPHSYSECLFLSLHFAKQKKYKQLKAIFERLSMVTAPSENDRKMFTYLFRLLAEQGSPESRALALSVFAQCQRAQHLFSGQEPLLNESDLKEANQVFHSYLKGHKPHIELDLSKRDREMVDLHLKPPYRAYQKIPEIQVIQDSSIKHGLNFKLHSFLPPGDFNENITEADALKKMVLLGEEKLEFLKTLSLTEALDVLSDPYFCLSIALACEKKPTLKVQLQEICLLYRCSIPDITKDKEKLDEGKLSGIEKTKAEKKIKQAACLDSLMLVAQSDSPFLTPIFKKAFVDYQDHLKEFNKIFLGVETAYNDLTEACKKFTTLEIKSFSLPSTDDLDTPLEISPLENPCPVDQRKLDSLQDKFFSFRRTVCRHLNSMSHSNQSNSEESVEVLGVKALYETLKKLASATESACNEYIAAIAKREEVEEKRQTAFTQVFFKAQNLYPKGGRTVNETRRVSKRQKLIKVKDPLVSSRTLVTSNKAQLETLQKKADEHKEALEGCITELKVHPDSLCDQLKLTEDNSLTAQQAVEDQRKKLFEIVKTIEKEGAFHTLGNDKLKPTLSRLLDAWRTQKLYRYQNLLHLSSEQAQELDSALSTYLVLKTQAQDWKRLNTLLEKTSDENLSESFFLGIERDFSNKPHYPLTDTIHDRLYLYTEATMGLRLRDPQVQFMNLFFNYCINNESEKKTPEELADLIFEEMREVSSKEHLSLDSLLNQLGTGSGKSKVLAQLIQEALKQLQEHEILPRSLNGAIWPNKLYQEIVRYSDQKQQEVFHRPSQVLQITREMDLSNPQKIDTFLVEVASCIEEGRTLHIHPTAIKSLHLKHLEYLNEFSSIEKQLSKSIFESLCDYITPIEEEKEKRDLLLQRKKALEECLPKVARLQSYLRKGVVSDDECHISQDPLSAHLQFALGERVLLPPHYVTILGDLFELLNTKELAEALDIVNNHQKKNLGQLDYSELVKEHLIPTLVQQSIYPKARFIDGTRLSKDHLSEIKTYLSDPKKEGLDTLEKYLDASSLELIYLVRGLVHKVLPTVLTKEVNLDFAIIDNEHEASIAVTPFRAAGDPNIGSEFESLLFSACASGLSLIYKGLNRAQSQRFALYLMRQLNGHDSSDLIHHYFGENFTYAQLRNLARGLEAPPELRHEQKSRCAVSYLQQFGFKELDYSPSKISASPQVHNYLSASSVYTSATPGHERIYGPENSLLKNLDKKGEDKAKKLFSKKTDIEVKEFKNSQDTMESLVEQFLLQENAYMLVDAGALLKDSSELDIARHLMKRLAELKEEGKRKNIEAIEFYIGDKTYVLTEDQPNRFIPADECHTPPHSRLRYCDHAHCTGADFNLPDHATGMCTASLLTTNEDEMIQGIGRFRNLEFGPKILVIVDGDPNKELSPEELLAKCKEKQNQVIAQKITLALCHEADMLIRKPLIDQIVPQSSDAPLVSAELQLKAFKKFQHLIVTNTLENVTNSYKGSLVLKSYPDRVKDHLKLVEKQLKELGIRDNGEIEALRNDLQELIEKGILPEKTPSINESEQEEVVEAEKESCGKKQAEKETNSTLMSGSQMLANTSDTSWDFDLFSESFLPGHSADTSFEALKKRKWSYGIVGYVKIVNFSFGLYELYKSYVRPHEIKRRTYTLLGREEKTTQEETENIRKGWIEIAKILARVFIGCAVVSFLSYHQILNRRIQIQKAAQLTTGLFLVFLFRPSIKSRYEKRITYSKVPRVLYNPLNIFQRTWNALPLVKKATPLKLAFHSLAKLPSLDTSLREKRRRLGQSYTDSVDRFFHPTVEGFTFHSHVSSNIWSQMAKSAEESQHTGPFTKHEPKLENILVVREGTRIDTVMGSASDLRQWRKALIKDRRYHKKHPEASPSKRRIEIRHTHTGCIDRCTNSTKNKRHNDPVEEALRWEQIKWKLFDGHFDLSESDLELFEARFKGLGAHERVELKNFLISLLKIKKKQKNERFKGTQLGCFTVFRSMHRTRSVYTKRDSKVRLV